MLVRERLITPEQLEHALRVQSELPVYAPLGHILCGQGIIAPQRLNAFLRRHKKQSPLGEILVRSGAITPKQLDLARDYQRLSRVTLGAALVRLGFLDETTFRQALCTQLSIKVLDLDAIPPDPSVRGYINSRYAAKHLIVPLARVKDVLVVAMDDPTQIGLVDELGAGLGLGVEVVTATTDAILRAYGRVYEEPVPRAPADVEEAITAADDVGDPIRLTLDEAFARERPITPASLDQDTAGERLVRHLLQAAIGCRASDIHLEVVRGRLQVRFRVDGVLQAPPLGAIQESLDRKKAQIVSRIKILSKLDIAERRRPQDGSFRARLERVGGPCDIDFRVSIVPGYYGENTVIRILDPLNAPTSVEALGFSPSITARLRALLQLPSGLILVTGPTGSGKSTTLFGALRTISRPDIKVLTAENPIEYVCDRFSQHEVNEKVGNTFATYLRAFLRQDPEVIMIGEIRDSETVELAFRAAQTGHLVLSTMHTNNAVGALTRLRDLGVDPNLITASLRGVLAQRLIRRVCAECKEEYTPAPEPLAEVMGTAETNGRWYRGRGCGKCQSTGYRGRLPVAELWTPSDNDIVLINKTAPFDEVVRSAQHSTIFMTEDVREHLRKGWTNPEELIRALPYSALDRLRSSRT